MKIPVKILCTIFFSILTIPDVLALPNCPSDLSAMWDNCHGTFIWSNGDKYFGEWKSNMTHGKGKFTYANGDEYVGLLKDNLKHGLGKYTYSNGDEYEGEWKDNSKYGLGEYIHANGDEYVGEWKDNLKHGHGEYTHANGDEYVGLWKDDLKHGLGTYTWSNGDEYVGLWKDGIQYDGDTKNQLDNQKLGKSLNELWNRVFKNDKSVKNLEIEDSKMKLTPTPIEKDFLDALYGGKSLRKLFNVEIINFDGFFETDTIYYAEVKAIIEEKKLPEELRKSIYRSFLRENGASFSEAHILAESMGILSIFNIVGAISASLPFLTS